VEAGLYKVWYFTSCTIAVLPYLVFLRFSAYLAVQRSDLRISQNKKTRAANRMPEKTKAIATLTASFAEHSVHLP